MGVRISGRNIIQPCGAAMLATSQPCGAGAALPVNRYIIVCRMDFINTLILF